MPTPDPVTVPRPPKPREPENDGNYCNAVYGDAKDGPELQKISLRMKREEGQIQTQLTQALRRALESRSPSMRAAALFYRAALTEEPNFQSTDALAELAVHSSEAPIYALAYRNCKLRHRASVGFCAELSAVKWATRDPDNGTAWLFAANEAIDKNDMTERDEALFRLSVAGHFDPGLSALVALQNSLTQDGRHAKVDAALTKLSYALVSQDPSYQWVAPFCTESSQNDPNREQVCSHIAAKLAQDDSSLASLEVASDLGRQLQWEPSKLEPMQKQVAALKALKLDQLDGSISSVVSELQRKGSAEFWCNYSVGMAQYQGRHLRLGEVRALRATMTQ